MLFWLTREGLAGLKNLLISGKDIPGVGNSVSVGTDIGMSRADTGMGLEVKKHLCSCDVW